MSTSQHGILRDLQQSSTVGGVDHHKLCLSEHKPHPHKVAQSVADIKLTQIRLNSCGIQIRIGLVESVKLDALCGFHVHRQKLGSFVEGDEIW